jgi:hypothetical protein
VLVTIDRAALPFVLIAAVPAALAGVMGAGPVALALLALPIASA